MNMNLKTISNRDRRDGFAGTINLKALVVGSLIACGAGFTAKQLDAQTPNTSPLFNGNIDPQSRGVTRAVEGVLQGEGVGEAARQGLREGARTAVESPEQTQLRDQRAFQQSRGLPEINPAEVPGTNQAWYRDQSGRTFYMDQQGRRIYSNQPLDTLQSQTYPGDGIGVRSRGQVSSRSAGQQQAIGQSFRSTRPTLGVSLSDSAQGVRIERVARGSVAEQSGLRSGDVITSFNGQPINNISSIQQSVQLVNGAQPVDLKVLRNGQQYSLTAQFDNQQTGDRYQAAKPPMDRASMEHNANQNLNAEVQSLRQQINQLQQDLLSIRQQMNLSGQSESSIHAQAEGELNANESNESGRGREAKLDTVDSQKLPNDGATTRSNEEQ